MFNKTISLFLLLVSSSAWAEGTMSLSTGFDFTSGNYGQDTTTNIWYIPVTAKYQADNYFLKLTVPYIRITSVGGVVRGMGKIKLTSTQTRVTEAGLGDVIASAGHTIYENNKLMLQLVGKIKFGTANPDKYLGTGENDYSAQLDGFYDFNNATLFATVGYTVLGAPEGVTLNNIAYGTLGFSKDINKTVSAGIMLDTAQASSDINPATRELSVFVANRLSDTWKVQGHLMKGFSDSSPDFGFGLALTGSF